MNRFSAILTVLIFAVLSTTWAATTTTNIVSPHKGIQINAHDAYEMKISNPDKVLLLDVRTRAEVHHTGIADAVDANIPYHFETTDWKMNPDRIHGTFKTVRNPDFTEAVKNLVKQKNLTPDTPIILMCKGNTLSPWAAMALYKAGFTNVYTQYEGFEGVVAEDGPDKGKRVVNGWKNDGLPWSYELLPDKMYFNFAPQQSE